MAIEKIKTLGAVLELPAKLHFNGQDYSFELNSIET